MVRPRPLKTSSIGLEFGGSRGSNHTANILLFKKTINNMSSTWIPIIVHEHELRAYDTPEQLKLNFKDLLRNDRRAFSRVCFPLYPT